MKFLVDAQLPRRLALWLQTVGYTAVHTLDLPNGNQTSDTDINALSLRENYVLISKDADFVSSFILKGEPYKLLLISTGNITNHQLELLFRHNIQQIADLFKLHDFLEMNQTTLTVHL